MTAASLRPMTMDQPEWRRCGRFLLLAAALHGGVLAYPLHLASDPAEPPPLLVKLAAPAEPKPLPVVEPLPKPLPVQPAVKPEKPAPRPARAEPPPRPLLAMPAEAPAAGPVVAVAPPAPPAAPVEAPARASPVAAAPGPLSPARFDAAYLQNPEPRYPPLSRRLGEEGKVLLRVRVTPEGTVAAVDLEKSSNFERLDAAARQAVARWRFVPARRGDEVIEGQVIVPVVFRLES